MYVDNEAGKSISAIDVGTLSVVRTYALGFTPGFAATAPGGELWVSDDDNGRVVFYRTDSDVKLGELATGAGAHAIAFSADGSRAYVTNQRADTVSVVDVSARAVLATIPVGSKPNGVIFRPKS
jgi:YVTN family beta-propeller protein